MSDGHGKPAPGAEARRLIRSRDHGALGTLHRRAALCLAGRYRLRHRRQPAAAAVRPRPAHQNLLADPRVSLLFEATGGHPDPLAGPRLTRARAGRALRRPRAAARFAARHPASAAYAGFGDFHLYRVVVERGHLVAGFRPDLVDRGRRDLRFGADASALAAAEADIVAHMNEDHADAVALYAERLLGLAGTGWRMTGIDPEGLDLRRRTARWRGSISPRRC